MIGMVIGLGFTLILMFIICGFLSKRGYLSKFDNDYKEIKGQTYNNDNNSELESFLILSRL